MNSRKEVVEEITKGQIEEELVSLTKKLGGGWGWDQNIMPYLKLTLPEARALKEKYSQEEKFEDTTDELCFNLVRAEQHSRQAHDLLYMGDGPKRSVWYKMALGRAQSLLMNLYMQELRRDRRRKDEQRSGEHEGDLQGKATS